MLACIICRSLERRVLGQNGEDRWWCRWGWKEVAAWAWEEMWVVETSWKNSGQKRREAENRGGEKKSLRKKTRVDAEKMGGRDEGGNPSDDQEDYWLFIHRQIREWHKSSSPVHVRAIFVSFKDESCKLISAWVEKEGWWAQKVTLCFECPLSKKYWIITIITNLCSGNTEMSKLFSCLSPFYCDRLLYTAAPTEPLVMLLIAPKMQHGLLHVFMCNLLHCI